MTNTPNCWYMAIHIHRIEKIDVTEQSRYTSRAVILMHKMGYRELILREVNGNDSPVTYPLVAMLKKVIL